MHGPGAQKVFECPEEAKFLIRKMKTELSRSTLIDKNIISEYDVDNLCLQTLCQLETAEAMGALRVLENESMFTAQERVCVSRADN